MTAYGKDIGLPGSWSNAKILVEDLSIWYKKKTGMMRVQVSEEHAVKNVSLPIFPNKITGIMGPSGCGKSTLLKALNRLLEENLRPGTSVRHEGRILLDGKAVHDKSQDLNLLRARVGIVLQEPAPFPNTIFENVAFAIRLYQRLSPSDLEIEVESALRKAALWEEVKDRLQKDARSLSGGQQQRLCFARSIAAKPEVILMDEPTSKLDIDSVELIEDAIHDMRGEQTIVIVTHNAQQAVLLSDYIAFMYKGDLVEFDTCDQIMRRPQTQLATRYITGRRMNGRKNGAK